MHFFIEVKNKRQAKVLNVYIYISVFTFPILCRVFRQSCKLFTTKCQFTQHLPRVFSPFKFFKLWLIRPKVYAHACLRSPTISSETIMPFISVSMSACIFSTEAKRDCLPNPCSDRKSQLALLQEN